MVFRKILFAYYFEKLLLCHLGGRVGRKKKDGQVYACVCDGVCVKVRVCMCVCVRLCVKERVCDSVPVCEETLEGEISLHHPPRERVLLNFCCQPQVN